MLQPLGM